jgi:hypothetical protein
MKPQTRPFTVEIKRSRRPASSRTVLTASPLALFDRSLPERPPMNARPNERGRDAASDAALSEAERVFSRSTAAMRVATADLDGIDPLKNADRPDSARPNAEVISARPDTEVNVVAKPRSGRVHPDLLSAVREEERIREAQAFMGARRLPRGPRRSARSETAQPEETRREEHTSSRCGQTARVGLESLGEILPPSSEVATLVPEQHATVMPAVDQAVASTKPSGVGRRKSGGWFRRKVERTGQATSVRAGERWKRRLPPVCR